MVKIIGLGKNNYHNRILVRISEEIMRFNEKTEVLFNCDDLLWMDNITSDDTVVIINSGAKGFLPGTVTMHKMNFLHEPEYERLKNYNVYMIFIEISEAVMHEEALYQLSLDVLHIIKKLIAEHEFF